MCVCVCVCVCNMYFFVYTFVGFLDKKNVLPQLKLTFYFYIIRRVTVTMEFFIPLW